MLKKRVLQESFTRKLFASVLEERNLEAHPKKIYIQPARHGVNFCGRVIYKDRIYISNRVVKACIRKIDSIKGENLNTARKVAGSVNSYTGLMAHYRSFNIQKRIASIVLRRFSKWLYFDNKHGHLVCKIKNEYKEKYISKQQIKELDNYVKCSLQCRPQ